EASRAREERDAILAARNRCDHVRREEHDVEAPGLAKCLECGRLEACIMHISPCDRDRCHAAIDADDARAATYEAACLAAAAAADVEQPIAAPHEPIGEALLDGPEALVDRLVVR